jgi:hypothetical protein
MQQEVCNRQSLVRGYYMVNKYINLFWLLYNYLCKLCYMYVFSKNTWYKLITVHLTAPAHTFTQTYLGGFWNKVVASELKTPTFSGSNVVVRGNAVMTITGGITFISATTRIYIKAVLMAAWTSSNVLLFYGSWRLDYSSSPSINDLQLFIRSESEGRYL